MKTMKEITAMTKEPGYAVNFWNAMKFDSLAESRLENTYDSNTGAYYMPSGGDDIRSIVAKNGIIRNLATVHKKYDGSSSIWAYASDDYASFVTEGGTIPGFDVKDDFTKIPVNAYKLASLAKLSCEFAYDSQFDIEKYIKNRLGKSFAKAEDKAFIGGNGTTEPTGILHATNGAQTGVTSENLTLDSVIGLFFSVKPEYRKNAVWMMNDTTALTLRRMKDSDGGYLWNITNDTVLGKPVVICNEMPNVASGKKPVAFGDFSFYNIVDRSPVSVKPIKELYAANDRVGYVGYERLDGRLIRTEAVKVIKITA